MINAIFAKAWAVAVVINSVCHDASMIPLCSDKRNSFHRLPHAGGTCVIKLFVMIASQISKFKFKYATGVRHPVTGSVGWMFRDASVFTNRAAIHPSVYLYKIPKNIPLLCDWD